MMYLIGVTLLVGCIMLIGYLSSKNRPEIEIENDFFGKMVKKNKEDNFFECNRYFKPVDTIIKVWVEGYESGITQYQIDCFKHIEDTYSEFCEAIAPLVEQLFGTKIKDFRITDFQEQFEAYFLGLTQSDGNTPFLWIIQLADRENNLDCMVSMSDFEITEISGKYIEGENLITIGRDF